MKYEQFLEIYNAGPEATCKLFMSLMQAYASKLLVKRTEQLKKSGLKN